MKIQQIIQEADEMEIETPVDDNGIKNPSFVFEINGTFNFRELENILRNNEQGLTLDNYELKINTKGLINDEDYENFIVSVEKLRYLKYMR